MAFDINDPADVKLLEEKINEATAGLKNKNGELIGEQKKLKDKLTEVQAQFEGIDPVQMRALLKRFENDEEAKLIAEGKMDEVVNRRTERMRGDFEGKLKEKDKQIEHERNFSRKFKDGVLSSAIREAAVKAGCLPEATDDVYLRSRAVFQLDDEGNPIAKKGDEVIIGKDGKTPLQPAEWVESLRETAPHFWPKAQGTGASGSGGTAAKKFSDLSEAERVALHKEDPKKYRALRDADKAAAKA